MEVACSITCPPCLTQAVCGYEVAKSPQGLVPLALSRVEFAAEIEGEVGRSGAEVQGCCC